MAKDFAALDDRLSEAIRLLFAEIMYPARKVAKRIAVDCSDAFNSGLRAHQ